MDLQVAPASPAHDPDPAGDVSNSATHDPERSPSPRPSAVISSVNPESSSSTSRLEPSSSSGIHTADDAHDRSTRASSVTSGNEASAAVYGTRSRIRPGPRPNYSDDQDLDLQAKALKNAAAQVNPPPAVEVSSTPQTGADMAATPIDSDRPRGFTAANAPRAKTNGVVNGPTPDAQSSPNYQVPAQKQKRKYVWRNGSKPSPSTQAGHVADSVPGTSQLSTSADEPPPSKRRKTADNVADGSSVGPSTTSRKGSAQGGKNSSRDTCVVTFEKSGAMPKNGKMHADDGTVYSVDDNVYLICEPPGDPYYLCRIMQFLHDEPTDPKSPITMLRVNWFYRPKDIGRFSVDTRILYATMQSDEVPLSSLRGKCHIKHRSEIGPNQADLDEYKRGRDAFWFSELYDRYIHRPYNMVPAKAVINVPKDVKRAIDERWKFLIVEPTRLKELTSAVKLCKRCNGYCAPVDSVDCGVCRNTYHMACVNPPLSKKPSRGFAWSCGPCSRAQEKRLEARQTSLVHEASMEGDEEIREGEDEKGVVLPTIQKDLDAHEETPPITHNQAEVAKAQMWPWRYLGIHCKVEDVLQYDDRAIYPRASSRLGTRHQAVVIPWFGQPVELVKPLEVKKKLAKSALGKKDYKAHKDMAASIEADKLNRPNRPRWVQDEPPGYVARGEDYDESDERCTATRLFTVPPDAPETKPAFAAANAKKESFSELMLNDYMERVKELASQRGFARPINTGVPDQYRLTEPTNYLDRALLLLHKHKFNSGAALNELRTIQGARDYGDPSLSKEELKKFEDGVSKFGSELRLVKKHVKTRPHAQIVRWYYNWKKTPRGKEIWGRYDARRGSKKRSEASWTEIADDEDDSAFDSNKAFQRKRKFSCKFCLTRTSRQWRRAPGIAPGATILVDPKASAREKSNQLVVALCQRCAFPWRRYSIRWEEPEEYAKSLNAPGGRQWKKLQDEMMLRELVLANEAAQIPTTGITASAAASIGITLTVPIPDPAVTGKKKAAQEREALPSPAPPEPQRKKLPPAPPPPRPPTPPIVPAEPKMRVFPCAVCMGDSTVGPLISCASCKLTVHRHCYAIPVQVNESKWTCDTCANDKNSMYSLNHNCILCTMHERPFDLVEQPKVSHKKKTDRDREKERQEKQLADDLSAKYKREQLSKGRPVQPREALKHTSSNNWIHVVCAIWTPEIKFGKATELDNAEGMGAVMANPARLDPVCKVCRQPHTGATVPCHYDKCNASFHVGCAHEAGYRFGFDIKPVKGAKKDSLPTLAFGGESGLMSAVVYCREHDPSATSIMHDINERGDQGETALEAFVKSYKQADTTLTGTARKANMLTQSTKAASNAAQAAASAPSGRRISTMNNSKARRTSAMSPEEEADDQGDVDPPDNPDDMQCRTCRTTVSFRWWGPCDRLIHDCASYGSETARLWAADELTDQEYRDRNPDLVRQCHKCHLRELEKNDDTPPTPPASEIEAEDDSSPEEKSNYFTRTMSPPAPPERPPPVIPFDQQFPNGPSFMPSWNEGYNQAPPAGSAGSNPVDGVNNNPTDQFERWTQMLWASKIILTMPNGQAIHFNGREFGNSNDHPLHAWEHLVDKATEQGGFEQERQIIVTDERLTISDTNSFTTGLAAIIKNGAREVHWHVEDQPPFTMPPQQWHPPQGPPPVHPPTVPSQSMNGPPPPAFPPQPSPRPGSTSLPQIPYPPPRYQHSSFSPPAPPRRFPGAMTPIPDARPTPRSASAGPFQPHRQSSHDSVASSKETLTVQNTNYSAQATPPPPPPPPTQVLKSSVVSTASPATTAPVNGDLGVGPEAEPGPGQQSMGNADASNPPPPQHLVHTD